MIEWFFKSRAKEITNSEHGVDSMEVGNKSIFKWHRFPLIPIFSYREKNEHNACHLGVSWLNMRWWTGDSPNLGFAIELDGRGSRLTIRLPYSIFWAHLVYFPCGLQEFSMKHFWRRGFINPHKPDILIRQCEPTNHLDIRSDIE